MRGAILAVCCVAAIALGRPDTLVQRIVASVSQDSIQSTIQRLQAFGTRRAEHDSCRAAVAYALARMREYGCDTVYPHHFDSLFAPSAVGVKRGRLDSAVEYIICGHIDAVGNTIDTAPGADDNASGASVVLEACRVFTSEWFAHTVRFICFSAEEGGGVGSTWYAYQARLRGDSILGVLNFDMVGYGPPGRDSVVVAGKTANPNCSVLVNTFCTAARRYTELRYRPLMVVDSFIGWDHYAFWENGYPGLLCAEVVRTPEYHSNGDTLGPLHYEHCGVNNLPMCTQVSKAGTAALAVLAGVNGGVGTIEMPEPVSADHSIPQTIYGRVLVLGGRQDMPLLDITGRRVIELKPGENDVRYVAPGVYFVRRPETEDGRPGTAVRKVVIQK